jgi:hypothetical protein
MYISYLHNAYTFSPEEAAEEGEEREAPLFSKRLRGM